jgi:hypothetical protein
MMAPRGWLRNFTMISAARGSSAPITTRSGHEVVDGRALLQNPVVTLMRGLAPHDLTHSSAVPTGTVLC